MVNRAFQIRDWLHLALMALLLLNTALLGWTYHSFRTVYPGPTTRLGYKQEVARDLAEYNRRLAAELEVLDRSAVREALAAFNYDVEIAGSGDELTRIILDQGRRVQEIILREADALLQDRILAEVKQDEGLRNLVERTYLTLRITDEGVTASPPGILSPSTKERIKELVPRDRFASEYVIEMEVDQGTVRLAVPYNPVERLQALTEELDSLRLRLHELRVAAGLAEMTGRGIRVELYDEEGGTSSGSIIHDADIRDIVNELYGSGAQGISVGGHRLTVTSSIRCSGSLIKVDGKLIAVNPVVIEAVGDPDLLRSGLDIIKTSMEIRRGIRFKITELEELKLPAYSRSAP